VIDLRTDDGMREAVRAIAAWPPPDRAEPAPPFTAPAPLPVALPRRRPVRWAAAAAILALGLVAAVLVTTGRDRTPTAEGAWRPMASSPLSARFAPVSLWLGDRLLIWGGHDAEGTELDDGATYDPATDTWSEIADQPFPYERRTGSPIGATSGWWATHPTPGAWFEGRAYFVLTSPEEPWAWDLVSFDPAADRWEEVDGARFDQQPNDALVRREGTSPVQVPVSLHVHDDELLVFGWDSQRSEYGVASVDPGTPAWGVFTGVPGSGREYGLNWSTPGPVLLEDRYLTWVRGQGLTSGERFGFALDLRTGQTTDVRPPVDRADVWLSGMGDDGVAVGRWMDGGLADATRFAARLDPVTGRWTEVPTLASGPTETADEDGAPAIAAAGERTVVVGGVDRRYEVSGLRSVHGSSVLDGDRWLDLPEAPIDLDRADPIVVWTGSTLLVWGGIALADDEAPTATVPLADGARLDLG
jgi:hypothetical protein